MIARRDPSSDEPRLQLEPASSRSRLWLWLLGAVLPIALSIVFSLLARSGTRPSRGEKSASSASSRKSSSSGDNTPPACQLPLPPNSARSTFSALSS